MSAPTSSSELYAVADFCLIPMGLETPSVGPQIAECQRVLEQSGLEYKVCPSDSSRRGSLEADFRSYSQSSALQFMGPADQCSGYGTNLEGPWDKVMKVIGDCHAAVHKMGTPRIATDIRIGTRTDKSITSGGNDGKIKRVEEILSKQT